MTHLRQLMLDELQRRNYSQSTVTIYIFAVEDFAKYFHRSPERLGPSHIREYQVYLFRERKLSPGRSRAVVQRCGFSSSRPFGDRICPMRFRFPSVPGSCRLYSVRKRWLG